MPTILAFIIITSSVVLYQSVTTIVQLYSLKGERNDLIKLEYSVNTKRVIRSLPSEELKPFSNELNYSSNNSKLSINRTSGYFPTSDEGFNSKVKKLLVKDTISYNDYAQLESYVQSRDYTKGDNTNKMYTILFVDYKLEEPEHKLLLINEDNDLLKNIKVK